jgi:hypothetical protein
VRRCEQNRGRIVEERPFRAALGPVFENGLQPPWPRTGKGTTPNREGHDFQSCQSIVQMCPGFSRCGSLLASAAESPPQRLKPSLLPFLMARVKLVPFPVRSRTRTRSCRVPHPSFRVLCEKRVGILTSHVENQNPNGLTLVESHLSQSTRKMGHRLSFLQENTKTPNDIADRVLLRNLGDAVCEAWAVFEQIPPGYLMPDGQDDLPAKSLLSKEPV